MRGDGARKEAEAGNYLRLLGWLQTKDLFYCCHYISAFCY